MSQVQATFLMTTYNGMPFVRSAIESITKQSTALWELVVVDDGSRDGTCEWLRTLRDPRIRVIELPNNVGQTAALNHGLGVIETEFTARLDQDDLASYDRAASQAAFLQAHPDVVLVSGWARLIDDAARMIGVFEPTGEDANALRYLIECNRPNPVAHSSVMFRTDVARAVGGYPASVRYANDYGLWCRLAAVGELVVEERYVCSLREHDKQTSTGTVPLISKREVLDSNRELGQTLGLTGERKKAWKRARRASARSGVVGVAAVAVNRRELMWAELAAFAVAAVR